jgi:hypothetical protein
MSGVTFELFLGYMSFEEVFAFEHISKERWLFFQEVIP